MKMKNLMKGGLLACSVAALFATSARAGTSATYHDADLLLGFYDPNSGSNDFVIDLGAISSFNFSTNFTILNSSTNLAHDLALATAFGTSWYSDSSLYFGLLGGPNVGTAHPVYITNPNGIGNAWATSNSQGTDTTAITTIGGAAGGKGQVASQTSTGLVQAKSATNSWNQWINPNGADGALDGAFTGTAGDGGISDVVTNPLEFEFLQQGSNTQAQSLGTWSLNSAGDLSFTTAAVPEPSTYATIALGAAILIFARRRRLLA